MLEDALDQYPGAVVVVTHDRSLMARVATRVFEIDGGRVVLYPGGYADYESARLARAALLVEANAAQPARSQGARSAARPGPAATPPRPPEDRAARAARRQRERDLARVEKDIETREARVRELETQLADPGVYHDASRSREIVAEYDQVRAELESLWQRLAELG